MCGIPTTVALFQPFAAGAKQGRRLGEAKQCICLGPHVQEPRA